MKRKPQQSGLLLSIANSVQIASIYGKLDFCIFRNFRTIERDMLKSL